MTDIAAEWLAARIRRRAFPAAIERSDCRIESVIQRADTGALQVSRGFENSLLIAWHKTHSNKKKISEQAKNKDHELVVVLETLWQ
ncbi:MAG TPA: hypothetical protein VFS61_03440 [Anaerolineales bacterium]|nr:hypothetical protein [Anaerolineales bacterium]